MPIVRVQCALQHDSGLAEDQMVNTFHFLGDGVQQEFDDWTAALDAFYTALQARYSTVLTGVANVKFYDLSQPAPRVPVASSTFSFTPESGIPALPSEVALCLSYQAAPVSGLNQARRRGRIFLGPLNRDASTQAGTEPRPLGTFMTAIATAATALATATFAAGAPWHIYSPTAGTSALVTDGWIDNAFDTQRRRGVAPTARTLWT